MTRRTPLWVRGQLDPDFINDPRRACITPTGRLNEIYFDDTIEALAACQAVCVRCPVFRDCTRWTLGNYDNLEYGTFAGLTQDVRRRIYQGKEIYYDWRQEWNRRHWKARLAAKTLRENYRAGQRKRSRSKDGMPLCPFCDQRASVSRNGRQTNSVLPDRQRYHCRTCNRNFLGEEL
jgi:hypothetical protein